MDFLRSLKERTITLKYTDITSMEILIKQNLMQHTGMPTTPAADSAFHQINASVAWIEDSRRFPICSD